jgi:hypothetical protein
MAGIAAAQGRKGEECSVRGRVIDDRGLPLVDAVVVVDAGPPTTWEDLIITEKTDKGGNFTYKLDRCPFPNKKMTLYVTSPLSPDAYAPFQVPFLRSNRPDKKFAGQAVRGKSRGDVEVGDVRVQVVFTAVTVKFVDQADQPLLAEKDWGSVWLRLKSADGMTVSEGGLSKSAIDRTVRAKESAMAMELPEGEWQIEVRFKGTPWLKANHLVEVARGAAPFAVTLQMGKENRPARR